MSVAGARQCLDLPYTFERPHVEGIVASQQHTLRLARGHQKLDRRLSMHNGVEQELVRRRLRRRFQSCPRLCSDLPTVIGAPGLVHGTKPPPCTIKNLIRG